MSKYLTIRRVDGGVIAHDGDEHIFTDSVDLAEFCVNWFYGYEVEPEHEDSLMSGFGEPFLEILNQLPSKKDKEVRQENEKILFGEHLVYCDKCGKIAREVFSHSDFHDSVIGGYYCDYCNRTVE
jgi:hypothetical protein